MYIMCVVHGDRGSRVSDNLSSNIHIEEINALTGGVFHYYTK